ncbi:MAG TPA: 16S rRNA (adenine(1518)-N(6)/adenine(1519)-N(6))-dimethyltransferase RsmA [Candidatus Gastranaerophilales bacterium]|nr:16S rRNA (adenine(1518)-N(6)/adenine(1519)-N(6))-dimethyltransferase RsmA [Candidatus Gastranaerophilales bacterium]
MNYLDKAKKFKTKKRLGQNFLIDEKIIDKIVETANLSPDEIIVEIGAGAGFVTEKLAKKTKNVIAIELDDDAVKELQKLPYTNINIIQQDILKTEFSEFVEKPVKIVANIPYYITSPIIARLLGEIEQPEWKNRELIKEIILMVQFEVAKRLVADEKSPSKEYGLISILVNYWCKTELICKVPAKSFYPSPKVDSALVKLTVRKNPLVEINNLVLFKKLTKAAFGMRRKTIKNAFVKSGFDENKIIHALKSLNIDPDIRGEKLSIVDFKNISDALDK